jgi:hypothetical protein
VTGKGKEKKKKEDLSLRKPGNQEKRKPYWDLSVPGFLAS